MDLIKTKHILEIMDGVGISEAGVFAEDDEDTNQLRGITEDKTIIMFTDAERFIDSNVGILSVTGLLSRLNLFDQEKMGVDLKTSESKKDGSDYVNKIVVKEGRRRSTVTTTDPNMLRIPTKYPDTDKVFTAEFTKDYVSYLNKMRASVSKSVSTETLYAEMHFDGDNEGDSVDFSIGGGYDDFDDKVEADIEDGFVGSSFSVQWKIEPFIKVFRQAAASVSNESFIVSVNDMGYLEVDIDGVVISIAPMFVSQPE